MGEQKAADREAKVRELIEEIKSEHPEWQLFVIDIPGDDEIYIARKCPWAEYKRIAQALIDDPVGANEIIVQSFLVHPRLPHEDLLTKLPPGKIVTLAVKIQEGLGFAGMDKAKIRNF